MIAEAIEKILQLAPVTTKEIEGNHYCKEGGDVERILTPAQIMPNPLSFNTLTGLCDYIKTNPDGLNMPTLILHVVDFDRVELLGPLQPDNDNRRFLYARAFANKGREGFRFGSWFALEDFIIRLQTQFDSPDTEASLNDIDAIIDLMGTIANENIRTHTDDKFSQSIQVKSGLTSLSTAKVQNPVFVHPWRTFTEIEQPEIIAVLRFKKVRGENETPHAALFESNGGKWKQKAIEDLKAWLILACPEIKVLA